MIICFSCSPKTKKQLDHLLTAQQYEDYADAISSAIENLVAIQAELGHRGHVIISEDFTPTKQQAKVGFNRRRKQQLAVTQPRPLHRDEHGADPVHFAKVSDFFSLDGYDGYPAECIASLPSDVWVPGETVPIHRWTLGQYNRLLPVKTGCRGLARLLRDEPTGVTLPEGPSRLAVAATQLGDYLAYIDGLREHSRDEALATAFPTSGGSVAKSRTRFANQFVASVNSKGQLSGLSIDLKLINWASGSNKRLQLTEAGWRFALMKNPVLDQAVEDTIQRFSNEETEFLLDHIARHVPAEDFAYSVVLRAILDGTNTPEAIDDALKYYAPDDEDRKLSNSFLASQRSGAVSRMTDLGLVERQRTGVRVRYVATPAGQRYLDEIHVRYREEE